jgi:hypothetical protein
MAKRSQFFELTDRQLHNVGGSTSFSNRHQSYDHRSPSRKQNIPNGIGNGVTERGDIALRFVLNSAKCSRYCPGSSAGTENDERVHL